MKNFYFLLFLFAIHQSVSAQCPPPGFPVPGSNCPTAPILCDNINGYCATLGASHPAIPFPGCGGGWVLNNDIWFGFYAGTTSISIQITPSNCTTGGQQGLQGAIYAGCGPPWITMANQCNCTTNPFTLSSNNFVIGQIYYIVLDGCAGNICDYSIAVTNGSTVPAPPNNPGPITGNTTVCQNTSTPYNIAPPLGATIYNWTLTPPLGTIPGNPNNNVTVNWGNTPGTTQLCVDVANQCLANPVQSCTTITVQPVPTATLSGSGQLCQGSTATVPLTVTFTGDPPWSFVYSINGAPQPAIQTSQNPYTLEISQPGTIVLQSVSSVNGNCPGTVSGSVTITETELTPTAAITNATCSQSNGAINLTPGGGTAPYMFNWSNGATTEDLSNVLPGTYTVTVTDANGCTGVRNYTVGDQPNQPNVTSNTTPSICEQSNGSINISVSGGSSPYTYNWSNGATTQNINNVLAGSYTVTVTGADGCTQTHTVTLSNDNPPITVNGNITANTACNTGTGAITTTVSPATPPGGGTYTYNWSNGATTPNISDLTPGSYTVTVTGVGPCSQVTTFTVPDNPNPPNATLTPTVSNCDLANGSVNLTVSGGVAPYTYLWSNGATTEDISNVSAGSFSVTVTGANGCTTTATTTVSNTNPPINVNGNITANTTCIGGNGAITTSVTPVPPPVGSGYTYSWSNGETTPNLSNLTPGTYTVTVTAGGSCTQVASFTVPDQPNVPVLSPNVTPANCGLSNGAINLGVSGSVSPYTFNWSNGSASQNLSDLPGGSYTVTVTGANGCTTVTTVTVPDNPITFTVNNTTTPNTSCDPATYNGSININVTPPGNYTYTWSNNASGTSLSGLAPGTYTVTVSAGGNCTQVIPYTVPNQPDAPTLSPSSIASTCGQSNGSASITVTGGVAPFTFIWSNSSTSATISNLPAGSYTVTVTGGNGCTTVSTVNVTNNNPPINITANITGNTSCISGNGAIDITVNPINTYTYQWSNGQTTEDIFNLSPGTYTVTVTTGVSCSQTASFTVPNDAQIPVLTPSVTPSICSNPDGAINLSVSGGQAPITFLWSNGQISQNLSGLLPGGYSVTVTTGAGCTAALSINVPSNDVQVTLTGNVFPNTSCTFPNGIVNLSVQPPAPPPGSVYSFIWSNGLTTQNLQDVPPGLYIVTVSAGPACTQTAVFNVANAAFPPEMTATVVPATCGLNNGAVNTNVQFGSTPYFYTWSNNTFGPNVTDVGPGVYSVTVTDANNCSATASGTVVNSNIALNITGTATPNSSCVAANGAINITVTPSGNYTYQWSNAATTEDLTGIAAGTYTVTVSAGGTCTSTASFTIANQTSNPVISETVTAAICDESNGAIDLSVTGATPPYTYNWSNGATTSSIADLPPGDYAVTVSGVNGCSATATINVPNNSSSFSLSGTAQPVTSCVSNNGSVNLTITPPGNFDIIWSNSATTEDISNLAPGTYTVTVTESGSCTASASFTVTDQTNFPTTSQAVTAETCGLSDGAIDLTVSGGTAPYTFIWSNSTTTEDLTGIAAGTYAVTVTGANGCTVTASATVPDNSVALSVNATTLPNTSCDATNGSINLTVSPAGTYTYLWSNSATTEDISGLAGGSYTVTVSAGGTCTTEATFTVGSTTLDPVIAQSITAAICGESNGAINLTISGGEAPFTFLWSNSQTTEDLSGLAPGSYSVQVTGANGCVATGSYTVPDNAVNFALDANPMANTSCDSPNGSIDLSVSPPGNYNYLWSSGDVTQDLTGLQPGTYSVTVTLGLTCSSTGNFNVGNNTNAPNFTQSIVPATCGSDNGSINLTTSGGTPPYQFLWSNNETTEDLTGIVGGNYSVIVTGSDGCANTGNFIVPDNPIVFDIAGTATGNTACTGGNGSVSINITPPGNYTYIWSNAATTPNITNLPDGSYQVTVTTGVTCTSVASFTVPGNQDVPVITAAVEPSICDAPDGSIVLTIVGGEQPYVFDWSNGSDSQDLIGILSGTYAVTVTAANGCTATGTYSVANNSNTFSFTGTAQPNTLCGSGNGSINLNIVPPGNNYTFLWSNSETTEDLTDLTPGTYTVTVSDGGSCTASASFTVVNNAPTVSLSGTVSDVLCFGDNSGEIVLAASGGVAPYQFAWTPDVTDPSALPAGAYTVVATDASGCTGSASFTVQQPPSAVQLACGQATNVSLPGATDGTANVTINGGTAPYAIDWSPGGSQGNVGTGVFTISNLGEGSYDVTVTDANGCPALCNFTMTTDDCVTALGTMQTSLLSECGDGCQTANYDAFGQFLDSDDVLQFILHQGTGNVIVNEIARSDQPTFCFDPALMSYGVTYYISAAAGNDDGAGNVILTDDCTVVTIGTPVVFLEIPVAATNTPASLSCLVSQVQLTATSSIPGSTFGWSTAGGSISGNPAQATVTATAAGTYTVVVTANGCSDEATVQVDDISTNVSVSIIASPGELLDCAISEITLSSSAIGAPDFDFAWFFNGAPAGTGISLTINQGGNYQVVATDPVSGCTGTASVGIDSNSDFPPLFVNPAPSLNCKDTSVTVSGGSSVFGVQFYWATISGTDTVIIGTGSQVPVNTPGTYYLVGTAPNGCVNAIPLNVSGDYAPPIANAGPDQVLDCVQTPITLNGSGSPGVTFLWTVDDPGIVISNPTSPSITINEDGVYTLTVTSLGNFCTDSDDVQVFQYENVPQGNILANPPRCFGETNGSIVVETDPANGPYQYQLNGQNYGGTNVFAPLAPGAYEIQVTDGQGCVWTTTVLLPEPDQLTVELGDNLIVELGQSATLQVQVNVPLSQLDTILWTPSDLFPCPFMPCTVQEIFPTQQTSVGVTVIDTNGCRSSDVMNLFVSKERRVFVPNAFSPNGDGVNDVFMIFAGNDVVQIKSFLVFSRWGETVFQYFNFQPNDPAYGWDGTHRGEFMNPAVFTWFALVEFIDGQEVLYEGDVSLIR